MIKVKKAFDRMNHNFVRGALSALGFADRFINWVMAAVEGAKLGIQINGKITSWIEGHSGLRQGCPLSPSLFVLCSEVLSRMIKRDVLAGQLFGVTI